MLGPGVAAGHPATADAGAEILAAGGSAADAAVAACLASCVAETLMTGLLGGGFAIHYDPSTGATRNLDFFVSVPSGSGAPMEELAVPFGGELVHYAIGASSCGGPGLPAGVGALWRGHGGAPGRAAGGPGREHGRLPWRALVEPALRLAREGAPFSHAHALCLVMLAPVMTMREGEGIYMRDGKLLGEGALLRQPELEVALGRLRDEGAAS